MSSLKLIKSEILKMIKDLSTRYEIDVEKEYNNWELVGGLSSSSSSSSLLSRSVIPLPYSGVVVEGNCNCVKKNRGLYTQCGSTKEIGEMCRRCEGEVKRKGAIFGTMKERSLVGIMEYKDTKGNGPVSYLKVMRKLKLSREEVEAEALRVGVVIDAVHFEECKSRRGRPSLEVKEVKEVKGKGRPSKSKKVLELEDETVDLFANMVKAALETKSMSKEVTDLKETEAVTDLKETEAVTDLKETEVVTDLKETEAVTDLKETEAVTDLKETEAVTDLKETEVVTDLKETEAVTDLKVVTDDLKVVTDDLKVVNDKEEKEFQKLKEKEAKLKEKETKLKEKELKLKEKEEKEAQKLKEKELKLKEKEEKEAQKLKEKEEKEAQKLKEKEEKKLKEKELKLKEKELKFKENETKDFVPHGDKAPVNPPSLGFAPLLQKVEKVEKVEQVDEEDSDSVTEFEYEGKKYLRSVIDGTVYDMDEEEIGKWDKVLKKIVLSDNNSEEEEEDYE